MKKIRIITDRLEMTAELNETVTANMLYNILPFKAVVNTWGEEIYFAVPIRTGCENAVEVVKEGDIGYWPEGNCFCLFFGKTPVSTEHEIKPASPVNIIGKLLGVPGEWKKIENGDSISLIPEQNY